MDVNFISTEFSIMALADTVQQMGLEGEMRHKHKHLTTWTTLCYTGSVKHRNGAYVTKY
jgi:hypothetical protein